MKEADSSQYNMSEQDKIVEYTWILPAIQNLLMGEIILRKTTKTSRQDVAT